MRAFDRTSLIIAGVTKAATTSLFMYLSAHPDICPSRVKETQHFLPPRFGRELPPFEEYHGFFESCGTEKYALEATAGYFYGGKAVAEAIKSHLDDARILITFREPVSRLFSFYQFQKSELRLSEDLTLEEYVRRCEALSPSERRLRESYVYWGLDGGFYSDYLDDWFNVFGRDAIKILFFDRFIQDPRSVLIDICEWLNIEHEEYIDNLVLTNENKTVGYRNRTLQNLALQLNWSGESFWRSHPRLKRTLRRIYYSINGAPRKEGMPEEMKVYLDEVFGPSIERLAQQLTGYGYTDLPNWLSSQIVLEEDATTNRS